MINSIIKLLSMQTYTFCGGFVYQENNVHTRPFLWAFIGGCLTQHLSTKLLSTEKGFTKVPTPYYINLKHNAICFHFVLLNYKT